MKAKKIVAVLLSVLMVVSAFPFSTLAAVDFTATGNIRLISDTTTAIAPGVTEDKIITNNESGTAQVVGHAVTLDMSNPTVGIATGYADYNGNTWKMQTVRAQADAYMKKTGEKVVVAVNADIYNMANGEPMGVLVMGGKVYNKGIGRPYFGVTKSGEIVMGGSLTEAVLSTLQEATGGFYMLLENGVRVNQTAQTAPVPKTAIGRKADGTIVIYTADGRNFPISNGLSDYDLTSVMMGLGCVDVFNFDGGGSATYLARVEGDSNLSLRSRPSDGVERSVSTTLFVTSSAKPSGEFDHASIAPNNELYTPESTVEFTASGVDSSGAKADLPADGQFVLADDSFGTITADGKFVSSGKLGTVTVNYVSGGAVCGTTAIDIVHPDTVTFADEEISLGFDDVSDLGLVVKYQTRSVNYKDGDFTWVKENSPIAVGTTFTYNNKQVKLYEDGNYAYTHLDSKKNIIRDENLTDEETADMLAGLLGSFSGNIFTSVPANTSEGFVTATYKYDESISGRVKVIVGKLPTIVWDFEDVDNGDGTVTSAEEYYLGDNGGSGILTTSNYGRGGKQSIEIASLNNEEPVRFGAKSLKLNYDFINCGAVTEGACIGSSEGMKIPGTPTGIGVWVYCPEGVGITYEGPGTQSGLWLRGYVRDANNNNMPYDFTLEPKAVLNADGTWSGKQPGLHWEGWMYCEADLTKMQGPFTIQPGMTFRLMFVAGTMMGTRSANSIYFDNFQFVYGTNVDDVDNPVIDSITANGAEIENGGVINSNKVTFDAYFHDVQNKYTTGIDASTIRTYIDGVNVANYDSFQYVVDPDGSKCHTYDVNLENGEHSITTIVRDGFGNESTETRTFTVEAEETDAPKVTVATREDSALIGGKINVDIKASDPSVITEVMAGLTFSNQFPNYTVSFGDNYTGTYSYSKMSKTLTINAQSSGNSADNDIVATVSLDVNPALSSNVAFTYAVKAGSYKAADDFYTFSADTKKVPVSATYEIEVAPVIVGESATIKVTEKATGNVATNVTVKNANTNDVIGVTDENGEIATDVFSAAAGVTPVYAQDDNGLLSFVTNVGSYDAKGEGKAPCGIIANAVADPATTKNFSWFSNPTSKDAQVVLYREAGTEEWTTVTAKSTLVTFTKGENATVNANNATITGLTPETTYEYKVGSGEEMSAVDTFTTTGDGTTSFFILGDMQSEDMTNVNALANLIGAKHYDFGIQTGDTVDDPTSYAQWVDALSIIGTEKLGSTDMIHVLGNHEYAGDANAQKAGTIYNLPDSTPGGYYSVTYGNTFVAVVNYSGNIKQYKNALDKAVDDALASGARWKILTIHQPAYYTNATGGNSDVHSVVPAAVDKGGFNFVFSGHDHSYARTAPMVNGVVDENGAVYYICGSSGEKSYTVTKNDEFNFEIVDDQYSGIYLDVTAENNSFTVNVYDVAGSLLDSYTMEKECLKTGHKYVHDSDLDKVICSVCGEEDAQYTGFITDTATGKNMYLLNGEKQTGWFTYIEEVYYFDENGLAVTGEKTIPVTVRDKTENVTFTFDENGAQVGYVFHKCADGYTRCYRGNTFITGWREIDGYYYFFTSSAETYGRMYVGTVTINLATGQRVRYSFDSNGHLKGTSWYTYDDGHKVLYYGPKTLTGWQTVDGEKYYLDPATGYMVTGEVEIDGMVYAFDDKGIFKHEGAHDWEKITAQKGTCTEDEELVLICKECGYATEETNKAPGHVDENADGTCDVCGKGADSTSSSFLSIFTRIYAWLRMVFAKIAYFFKSL